MYWVVAALAVLCVALVRLLRSRVRRSSMIGFVHPSAGGGGGGERVLWIAIQALMNQPDCEEKNTQFVLYTKRYPPSAGASKSQADEHLLKLVQQQFDVRLPRKLTIVYLSPRIAWFLEASSYPRLTLLLQSVCGGIALFVGTCLQNRITPVVVESVGWPFAYPLFRLAGARVVAYVHYPVISTDMIRRVGNGPTSSSRRAQLKLYYYKAFAWLYYLVGQAATLVMTNSTWTNNHIQYMWKRKSTIVYPPCNVSGLGGSLENPVAARDRKPWILSIGQFRPEKNHPFLVRAFHEAIVQGKVPTEARLLLVGGARNEADQGRVSSLRQLCTALGIADRVEFHVNCPFPEMKRMLAESLIGLHGMVDEHFGIVLVEYMASGCATIGHNSGGVRADIVLPGLGWTCCTTEEYVAAFGEVFRLRREDSAKLQSMIDAARKHTWTFSDQAFEKVLAQLFRQDGLFR